jgi:hypothetical protein
MAWSVLREEPQGALRVENDVGTRSARQVIISAILINILNPKLSVFFLAFLLQFVSANAQYPLARMFVLSAVFMLLTFAVFVGYGLLAASIQQPCHLVSARVDVDAPCVYRRVCRVWRQTRDNRSLDEWKTLLAEVLRYAHSHPRGQPWRQLQCVSCHGPFYETHSTIMLGQHAFVVSRTPAPRRNDWRCSTKR